MLSFLSKLKCNICHCQRLVWGAFGVFKSPCPTGEGWGTIRHVTHVKNSPNGSLEKNFTSIAAVYRETKTSVSKQRGKMIGEKGKLLYNVYRALTYGLSPFLYLHLRFRTLQGIEHPVRWPERLGRPSTSRPPGHLIWFHTASLGPVQLFFLLFFYAIKRNLDLLISSFLFLNLLSLLLGESLVKTQVRGFWIFIFNI